MLSFIQSLESRVFLSASPVTRATLAADQASIVADAANADAALKTLAADVKTSTTAIAADLKTLPKTNAPLLNTLKADAAKAMATLTADLNSLVKPGTTLAKKSAATGESLLTEATVKTLAAAATEITALGTVTTTPLANLAAFSGLTTVGTDLQALVTANPDATTLAADISTLSGNISTQSTAGKAADTQFAADIATLASDLSSVAAAVATFPNLIGTFDGSALVTKGKDLGTTTDLTLVITSEDAAGNLVGTVTDDQGDVFPLTGTVTLNGKFKAKATSASDGTHTLVGQFSNGVLTGTYKAKGNSGTFRFAETA